MWRLLHDSTSLFYWVFKTVNVIISSPLGFGLVVHWALGSNPCICLYNTLLVHHSLSLYSTLLVHHSLSLYRTLLVHHSLSLYILICLLYKGTLLYYIIHFNIQRLSINLTKLNLTTAASSLTNLFFSSSLTLSSLYYCVIFVFVFSWIWSPRFFYAIRINM